MRIKNQIIKALGNCDKASVREIAKTSGIENAVVISTLLELEQAGRVMQCNGYWWLIKE